MSPEQLQALRAKIAANYQPVHRADQYRHPQGWNDALDFVEKCIKEVMADAV